MFCPRCGRVLAESPGGETRCEAGDMGLSKSLDRALRECFVIKSRQPSEGPVGCEVGGDWFCPGCGVQAREDLPGDVRCPACHKSLAEFIHVLVEIHAHRRNGELA